MPNYFAETVLFGYPLIAYVLFRRLPLPKALIWTILGGYLFLPERTGINLPMIPTIDKAVMASLSAWLMCWVAQRWQQQDLVRTRSLTAARAAREPAAGRLADLAAGDVAPVRSRRSRLLANLLLALLLLSPLLTFLTNRDPVALGTRILPPIRLYDVVSTAMASFLMILPFLLARRHLASREAQRMMLVALVQAGLVYALLMLVEIRLSPRLHAWVYGFSPANYTQYLRGNRPLVFLSHGLRVGIFMAMAVLAAAGLWRLAGKRTAARWLLATFWLFTVLVLSKNSGATVIVILLLPLVLVAGIRTQIVVAALIAGSVLFYPMLRGAGWVPVDTIAQFATSISADRGASLRTRLQNEDELLAKAEQRPLLGWGGWGRSFIHDDSGRSTTILDGVWVSIIGIGGWCGYVTHFGLWTMPILLLAWRRRRAAVDHGTAALCLVTAANLVDLIPNSSMVPPLWLITGALMGFCETLPVVAQAGRQAARPVRPPARHAGLARQAAGRTVRDGS